MRKNSKFAIACAFGLLAVLALPAQAQLTGQNRFLTLSTGVGLPVVPIVEGWYPNSDGSVEVSFGYLNRNKEAAVKVSLGPDNFIEPAQFDGMQPTHFAADRATGVFTVTIPANMVDEGVWWNIKVGANEMLRVPGRKGNSAYELDRNPRPQGSVSPYGWFDGGERSQGPGGAVNVLAQPVKVGEPVTLSVNALDPSIRDPEYPAFKEPLTLRLGWFLHQGPGDVTFERHESTFVPEPPPLPPNAPAQFQRRGAAGPEIVTLKTPEGVARIIASFSTPGEYMLRTRIDNWNSPDSSEGNQCCWTNLFQRITVVP
jgi:hypothetical protein